MRDIDLQSLATRRQVQLQTLVDSLTALVGVLAHDPDPHGPWQRHFVDCLLRATALVEESVGQPVSLPQARLSELAGSVMSVYGGMGSFNDYAPLIQTPDGRYVLPPGTEDFDEVAGRVHEAALALRVVGDAP